MRVVTHSCFLILLFIVAAAPVPQREVTAEEIGVRALGNWAFVHPRYQEFMYPWFTAEYKRVQTCLENFGPPLDSISIWVVDDLWKFGDIDSAGNPIWEHALGLFSTNTSDDPPKYLMVLKAVASQYQRLAIASHELAHAALAGDDHDHESARWKTCVVPLT